MTKFIFTLVLAIAAMMASATSPGKVYYVVAGSYSTLDKAQEANENDFTIYEMTAKGNKYYRLCPAAFYNKADAQEYVRGFKQDFGGDAWVAPHDGLALQVTTDEGIVQPIASVNAKTRIYYVVTGSYSTLNRAKEHLKSCPDGLEGSIITGTARGKKVYRVAIACYASKSEAQQQANIINDLYKQDFWVLPHKGLAPVAYYGTNLRGHLIYLTPQ